MCTTHLSPTGPTFLGALCPFAIPLFVVCRYLHGLFLLANEEDPENRTAVCTGMIQMLASHPNKLGPYMAQIIEYMIKRTQDQDEDVALESCEFWTAFCEAQIDPNILKPFLPQLVPILLKNLVCARGPSNTNADRIAFVLL